MFGIVKRKSLLPVDRHSNGTEVFIGVTCRFPILFHGRVTRVPVEVIASRGFGIKNFDNKI